MLVEGQGISTVLVMVDTVLALLAQFEVLAGTLHHHIFAAARAETGDVTLSIDNQYLHREAGKQSLTYCRYLV